MKENNAIDSPNTRLSFRSKAAGGIAVGALSVVLSTLQALIQVPLLLKSWSASEYGVWITITSVVAFVFALDQGHAAYLGNEFSRLWEINRAKVNETINAGLVVATILSCIELGLGIALVQLGILDGIGSAGLSQGPVFLSLCWMLVGALINTCVFGIIHKIYPAAGLYTFAVWYGIAYRSLAFISVVACVRMGGGIVAVSVAQVACFTLCNIVIIVDAWRRFPELRPSLSNLNVRAGFQNFKTSIPLSIAGTVEQMAISGVTLFIAKSFDAPSVALVNTMRTVANTVSQASSVLTGPLVPEAIRSNSTGRHQRVSKILVSVWLVGGALASAGTILALPIIERAYQMWTRNEIAFEPWTFCLFAIAVLIRQWSSMLVAYLHGTNRIADYASSGILRATILILSTAILTESLGVSGAGLAAAIAEAASSTLIFRAVWRTTIGSQPALLPTKAALASMLNLGPAIAALLYFGLRHGEVHAGVIGTSLALSLGGSILLWRELKRI